jgi:hypothetical protein
MLANGHAYYIHACGKLNATISYQLVIIYPSFGSDKTNAQTTFGIIFWTLDLSSAPLWPLAGALVRNVASWK